MFKLDLSIKYFNFYNHVQAGPFFFFKKKGPPKNFTFLIRVQYKVHSIFFSFQMVVFCSEH